MSEVSLPRSAAVSRHGFCPAARAFMVNPCGRVARSLAQATVSTAIMTRSASVRASIPLAALDSMKHKEQSQRPLVSSLLAKPPTRLAQLIEAAVISLSLHRRQAIAEAPDAHSDAALK
mmetsp:Transcript_13872/g.37209  ORF Transcript_13872/g.37209 Transcript_13872/m.37209 type:complete len:119 (-) Transcript_13872:289-645(-)